MIVFPVLCIAMFRHFLDSPLKHLWIIFFWCLWCDTNSFRACSLSNYNSICYQSIHVHFDCVCFYMAWGLQVGLCWLCTVTSTFEWGMDTYACTLVCDLCLLCAIRWPLSGRSLSGFCVCDVYDCSLRSAGGCCCIVQLGSFDVYQCFHVIHCLHEFSLQMSVAIWYSYGRRSYAC